MTAQLRHDPFARATLMREVAHRDDGPTMHSCSWCGQCPRTLYRYWWEPDDATRAANLKLGEEFCSVGCWEAWTS